MSCNPNPYYGPPRKDAFQTDFELRAELDIMRRELNAANQTNVELRAHNIELRAALRAALDNMRRALSAANQTNATGATGLTGAPR